jgi:hypothetical protein
MSTGQMYVVQMSLSQMSATIMSVTLISIGHLFLCHPYVYHLNVYWPLVCQPNAHGLSHFANYLYVVDGHLAKCL